MTRHRGLWLALLLGTEPACGSSSGALDAMPDGGSGTHDGTTVPFDSEASDSPGPHDSDSPPTDATTHPADVLVVKDAAFLGDGAGDPRTFTVINQCTQTVWAATLPAATFPGGLVEMAPGYSFTVGVDNGWSGRIWGKTDCTTSGGTTTCASSMFPASLAELTLTSSLPTGLDFYDVSLVDGFNLPIELAPNGHTPNPAQPYNCGDPQCDVNLNLTCPAVLPDKFEGGVLACANDECKVLGDNDAASPDCIYPNQYTKFFKTACPTAYSFPYDDPTSTFTCMGLNDYTVTFCP
jgi:hypothetical protein